MQHIISLLTGTSTSVIFMTTKKSSKATQYITHEGEKKRGCGSESGTLKNSSLCFILYQYNAKTFLLLLLSSANQLKIEGIYIASEVFRKRHKVQTKECLDMQERKYTFRWIKIKNIVKVNVRIDAEYEYFYIHPKQQKTLYFLIIYIIFQHHLIFHSIKNSSLKNPLSLNSAFQEFTVLSLVRFSSMLWLIHNLSENSNYHIWIYLWSFFLFWIYTISFIYTCAQLAHSQVTLCLWEKLLSRL